MMAEARAKFVDDGEWVKFLEGRMLLALSTALIVREAADGEGIYKNDELNLAAAGGSAHGFLFVFSATL